MKQQKMIPLLLNKQMQSYFEVASFHVLKALRKMRSYILQKHYLEKMRKFYLSQKASYIDIRRILKQGVVVRNRLYQRLTH